MATPPATRPVDAPPIRERVELILRELDRLPTLPAVAARLIAATAASDSDAGQVAQLIELDPPLAASILRLVRRANLGIRPEGMTVTRAVALLGFRAIRNAALSVQIHALFASGEENPRAAATRREMWRHNLAVACVAELIAERTAEKARAGDLFVCGLLHDIGKIALDAALPKSFARVVERVEAQHLCICDVERQVFGLDHTVAGKRLVSRWGLAPWIVECVWLHHQPVDSLPSAVQFVPMVRIVHLADNLVRRDGVGFSGYQHVSDIAELSAAVGVGEAELDAVMNSLPARLAPLSDLVGFDGAEPTAEYLASLARANRELGRVNEQLQEANRRLELRSAVLAALDQFSRSARAASDLSEICLAAAAALRGLTGAPRVMVFDGARAGQCLHLGFHAPEPTANGARLIDAASDDADNHCWRSLECPVGIPVRASPDWEPLWARGGGAGPHEPLWMVGLLSTDTHVAAAILEAPEALAPTLRADSDRHSVLVDAIGRALTSAAGRTELERLSEDLLDANRRLRIAGTELVRARTLAMTAAVAAGAAHELNNPLSVISGRAQMALGRVKDPELSRELEIIVEQTRRATEIVSDLMQFAKPQPPSPVLLSVRDLLDRLCQHWRDRTGLSAQQLTTTVSDAAATVYADAGQLRSLLDAVVQNAAEAIDPATGRLQINSPSRASDDTVRIVVEDNGAGMSREVLEHACDPFFSSRPAGRGRGLGLSHAQRFADINSGRLMLDSRPGAGTRVTIELPSRPYPG